jgi:hypothetical protein
MQLRLNMLTHRKPDVHCRQRAGLHGGTVACHAKLGANQLMDRFIL